jgi:hypothetical protein
METNSIHLHYDQKTIDKARLLEKVFKVGFISAVVLPIIFGVLTSLFIFYGESLGISFLAVILASKIAIAATIVTMMLVPFILVGAILIYIMVKNKRAYLCMSEIWGDEGKKKVKVSSSKKEVEIYITETKMSNNDGIPKEVKKTFDECLFGKEGTVNLIPFFDKRICIKLYGVNNQKEMSWKKF